MSYVQLITNSLGLITLRYITLYRIVLYCITLHYITLYYITLHCITLHYIVYRILQTFSLSIIFLDERNKLHHSGKICILQYKPVYKLKNSNNRNTSPPSTKL